ncbi:MAG: D-alanyl-D-alanine carboxypeptidase [Clostridia bacterium]|nr:D-alanyl-D-alanine carboxypeptidase [Clostridia bacterium]
MLFKYIKRISKKVVCLTISIYLISTLFIIARAENYEWTVINNTVETNSQAEGESTGEVAKDELNLDCGSAILIEQNSGQVLYEKNAHEQLRPASVTKLMTILLTFEALEAGQIKLDDKVPCSQNAASMGGSQIWLDTREELTVNEMLKAMCVVSANDCTVAMAEFIAGSEAGFVDKMNEKAKELRMNDTCFKNCHGIDEDGHVTSSYDIAIMSRELLTKHSDITNYTTIYMDSLRDGKSQLVNTNKLIRNYRGATGLKTGSTSLALFNLSASATRDDLSLIAVVMKAPTSNDRFDNAKKLLDYGFKNYEFKQFGKAGDVLGNVCIEKGVEKSINAVLAENCGVLLKKGNENNVVQNVQMEKKLSAPVVQGEKIGSVVYSLDGNVLQSVDIISDREVKKETLINVASYMYERWFCLVR